LVQKVLSFSRQSGLGSTPCPENQECVEALAVRSGGRERKVVQARKVLCQAAVRRIGYSGAEVARFLGLTASAANRLVSQDEVPEVEGGYFMIRLFYTSAPSFSLLAKLQVA